MTLLLEGLLIFLWMQLTWVSGQQLNQSPQSASVQEGEDVSMNCTSSSIFNSLLWFKQDPGEGLVLLIALYKPGELTRNGKLTAQFGGTRMDSTLTIAGSEMKHSGTYFCSGQARKTSGSKMTFGKGTQLTVNLDITDPDPAVYQLKSPKSSKTSVCLFTDFDSPFNEPQSQEGTVIRSNTTVLDMRVMDSKSNGVLAWSNSTEFKCNSTFNEEFYSSSDFSCNATLIKKNFETDMNLNTRNLLVIGLRVLLLKVAGFDLFMTLRLWSR